MEALPTPYRIQPENKGRLLWLTGPPGVGKSTTAQLLARKFGYVYYEADCFNSLRNPYIPVDSPNPTMAQINQRPLKGKGLEKRKEAILKTKKIEKIVLETPKKKIDKELYNDYYILMCEDIRRERERIGGDWAVSACVLNRGMRDVIRSFAPNIILLYNIYYTGKTLFGILHLYCLKWMKKTP